MSLLNFRKYRRRYRRYRHENQYDSPVLLFTLDMLLGIAQVLFVGICFWGAWLLLNHFVLVK